MEKNYLFEKIEDYLKDRLPPIERAAFEKDIVQNQTLAEEVDLHKGLIEATGEKEVIAFRATLEEMAIATEQEFSKKTNTRKPINWLWIIGGILLIGLLLILIYPRLANNKQEDEEQSTFDSSRPIASTAEIKAIQGKDSGTYLALAQTTYTPLEMGSRSNTGQAATSPFEQLQDAYQNGDFREVLKLSTNLPENEQMAWLRLRAHANFQLGEYEAAAKDFEELSKNQFRGKEDEWYALLTFLVRMPATSDEFLPLLEKIRRDQAHPFQSSAEELFQELVKNDPR